MTTELEKQKPGLIFLLCLALALALPLVAAENSSNTANAPPPGIKALEAPGIHNLFSLGTNVFSGSSPEGDDAFAALERLGIKTIITVDGAKPDLEGARKHGLRYVHLPHGYDGINPKVQALIVKAAETLPGPFYVHCHHGKHRGPTAAAVICLAESGWTSDQAEAWLQAAGTATNYVGLYEVTRKFQKPTPAQLRALPPNFPETAKVSGLTDSMVSVDERWEHLKSVRAAGYKAPADHPDINPANEAVILWEHYREAQRLPEAAHHGTTFIDRLKTAESEVKEVEKLLRAFAATPRLEVQTQLDKAFDGIAKSCAACHKAYRDPSGIKSHP